MRSLTSARFAASSPLPTYSVPDSDANRLTLVADSTRATLDGSFDIALILCAALCQATRRRLRIVTRAEAADSARIHRLLDGHAVELFFDPQFLHLPESGSRVGMNVLDGELFVASCWRAVASLIGTVPDESILYLLQQDERLRYARGDEYLRCAAVMARPGIRQVVSTQLLYDHLAQAGLAHIIDRGTWFEPAFPEAVFHPRERPGKMRLLFCAQADNPTDLLYLGLELIERALEQRTIDPAMWELLLLGEGMPDVDFGDIGCVHLGNLPDQQYGELLGTVDVGIYLSASPHPGYPMLALAASGAVVVTNERDEHHGLRHYCENIIAAPADLPSLAAALIEAVALAARKTLRSKNHQAAAIPRTWNSSLARVLASVV